ncbi:hypothetical protein ACIBEJ_11510 [Nonomuraea sp. NPDC050790]|uniref:hypothetical protein n=1 Tax=Nonomuraea sp. NPDC050790 TaxID=3364371 RepID=UPI00379EE3B8
MPDRPDPGRQARPVPAAAVDRRAGDIEREPGRTELPATPDVTGAASQASVPKPSAAKGEGPDTGNAAKGEGPHTDKKAAEHFRTRWGPGDPAVKHLKDIRTVGGYLRIYTDLPEEADNSKNALTLCERGLDYLREQGVTDPVVFVQAEFGENGNPILANILGPADTTCRVTHPDTD